MRRKLFNFTAGVSFALCAAAAACWVAGVVRPTQFRLRSTPQRTTFLWLDPQHVVLSEQSIVPQLLPPPYVCDTSRFLEYAVTRPDDPNGNASRLSREAGVARPTPLRFRAVDTGIGRTIYVSASTGKPFVSVAKSYRAVEVPWWWLVLAFALEPAAWLAAHRRAAARGRRGLCPQCGYDLRATLERCPGCRLEPREPQHHPPMQRTVESGIL